MAETKRKGDLGEAMIMADALKRGYKVAMPVGDDWIYDLIVLRNGVLERVQCKYVESKGKCLCIPCAALNNGIRKKYKIKYTKEMIDWLAAYDRTTDRCYYVPASLLGNGMGCISLRLVEPKNRQKKKIHMAKDFLDF